MVPTAPAAASKFVFRCTTAGTSSTEPSWNSVNNGTSTTGGATFTNVTGQSTFAWNAAAGDYASLFRTTSTRVAGGDKVYVSSDHTETSGSTTYGSNTGASTSYSLCYVLSVNKAGSTPPAAADLAAGAQIICSGALGMAAYFPLYYYGITFSSTGSSSWTGGNSASSNKAVYFDTCTIYGNTASSIQFSSSGSTSFPCPNWYLINSTINLGAAGQNFAALGAPQYIDWINTSLTGTAPTNLFSLGGTTIATIRASDLSSVTGTLVNNNGTTSGSKFLFESCKIASSVTRYGTTSVVNTRDEVELVNCFDGTNQISERYQPAGTLTTERTITLSGGATDNVGNFSHKMVSGTNIDKYVNTLNSFWMDLNYTTTGSPKTATVEIISSGTLNNDEISLFLEYEATSGSSVSSFVSSLPATVLTSAAAVTSSTATWNSSPSTPQKQKLQVTFTPQTAGRVRGQVRLGKSSTTVYVNPQITIT